MLEAEIETTIQEFIHRELLDGQGEGLDATTQLFTLGILDSFSFLKLITFISDRFHLQIDLGQINPNDFSSIENMSKMISQRTAAASDALASDDFTAEQPYPFASVYNTTTSSTIALLFAGNLVRQAPVDVRWFLERSGLRRHSLAMISDVVFENGYNDGLSERFPGFDAVVSACKLLIEEQFPHARTLLTVGASAGAAPAIHVGHALGAKAVCVLGGRVARPGQWRERVALTDSVFVSVIGKTWRAAVVSGISQDEEERLRDAFAQSDIARRMDELVNLPETSLNHKLLDQLARTVAERPTETQFFFYYAESNPTDAYVAKQFRGIPNVHLHPVAVPDKYAGRDYQGQRLDHFIANVLAEEGQLERILARALNPLVPS